MRNEEVAQLLAVLNQWQYLPMSDEDSAKVTVFSWAEALDDDLPLKLALATVTRYYGDPSLLASEKPKVTPGMLNGAWRDQKRSTYERQALESSVPAHRVPMPYWFREAMMEAFGTANLQQVEAGLAHRKKSGPAVQAIFDAHMRRAGITPDSDKRAVS